MKRERFFSILLTLALVLGLMPGMSLTALAAGTQSDPITISSWENLNNNLSGNGPDGEGQTNPTYYKLTQDITPGSTDGAITVASGRYVVVDLDGMTISRILRSETDNGYVIKVLGDLTITGGGTITGGCNNSHGGGVYVDQGGTFTMASGTISWNDSHVGGGVYVNGGTFTMMDGTISLNESHVGGGVFVNGGKFTMKGGTIGKNSAYGKRSAGCGVFVNQGGTFTMENGTISENEGLGSMGGGVHVDDGTFTMEDGKISGNMAYSGGGVRVDNGGTFTMKGGTISGNNVSGGGSYGGGVNVYGTNSEFTMKGGTISGNSVTNGGGGGGVYVFMGGTFNMTGGAIGKEGEGNTVTGENAEGGGGVNVFKGTFNMTGGSISGNTAEGNGGGGVHAYGTFNMTGGTISGNTAKGSYGGGVYVDYAATFNMKGGAISGNTANSGGGVYMDTQDSTFNLSGKVDISDNKVNGSGNNVQLDSNVITIQGKLENTKPIGVTAEKGKDFTSGFKTKMPNADPADFFESDNSAWGVFWNSNNTEATMGPVVTVTFDSNIPSAPQTKKQNVQKNTDTELLANPFTWSGYRFTGWNTKADGTGKEYADKAKVTLTEDLELYAQWKARELNVSPILDQTWTGEPITPTVTVKDGDATLTPDTDYTVAYKDNTNVGIATVTVTGIGDYEDVSAVDATFKIVKADSSVTSAPAARTLTYNGQAQELVIAGEATGGTMKYAVTTVNEEPGSDAYTFDNTSIPSKTDAGTYYVWYKALGDENHSDSKPIPLTVTISPVDKTELKEAIAGAGAYYDTIKDRAEYAEVAAALKKAIDAATAVAANDNVTQSAVAQATVDVNGALEKAKAAVAAIDKKMADEAAAKAVIQKINALPNPAGVNDKPAVEAARAAYEALTEAQKKLVPADVLNKLTTAEAQIRATEADRAAAQAVIDAINALPNPAGISDKPAVEAARAAYEALTEAQKKLVPEDVLNRLIAAEEQVRAAEEAAKTIDIAGCAITVVDRTYTGKPVKKPAVTVMDGEKKLVEDTDYTVVWNHKVKSIGAHGLLVRGIGSYAGERALTFSINPRGTRFTKLTAGRHSIIAAWKKQAHITRYQIQIGQKEDFSDGRKLVIWKRNTLTRVIRKLEPGKTYYVRIRTYTRVKGRKYYSAWSEPRTVTTLDEADNAAAQAVGDESLDLGEGVSLPGIDGMIDAGTIDGIDMDGENELTLE